MTNQYLYLLAYTNQTQKKKYLKALMRCAIIIICENKYETYLYIELLKKTDFRENARSRFWSIIIKLKIIDINTLSLFFFVIDVVNANLFFSQIANAGLHSCSILTRRPQIFPRLSTTKLRILPSQYWRCSLNKKHDITWKERENRFYILNDYKYRYSILRYLCCFLNFWLFVFSITLSLL